MFFRRPLFANPLIALTAALLLLYGLTYHGWTGSVVDEAMMLGLTARLVEAESFQLNPLQPALLQWGAPQANPETPIYSKYAPGQSFLGLPFYAFGKLFPNAAEAVTPIGTPFLPLIPVLFAMATGSLMTILAALGVYGSARRLGFSERTAGLLFIIYGVGTLAWPYAKTFYNEPSTACALIGMIYFSVGFGQTGSAREGLAAGLCCGLAVLLRATSIVFAPILFLYLLRRWRAWLLPAVGVAAGAGLTLLYNAARFGNPLESGYEPGFGRAPWEALLGYVVSPSRSIFLFNPILLLTIPGVVLFFRRARFETVYLAALALAPVGVYSAWWAWDGGASLGPRFLIPSIPVAVLFLGPLIEQQWRPWLVVGLAALSVAAQLVFNLVTPGDIFKVVFEVQRATPTMVNWQFSHSILANLWAAYSANRIDSLLLRQIPVRSPILFALLMAAVVLALTVFMFRQSQRLPRT